MELGEKTLQLFGYVKDNGGEISVSEAATALDRNSRSISASVNDMVKKGLAERILKDSEIEGEKAITFIKLTDLGQATVGKEKTAPKPKAKAVDAE